jgi:hypothetical protein
MKHVVPYKIAEGNGFAELEKILLSSASAIISNTEEELEDSNTEDAETETNESVIGLVGGAILSFGKLSALVGRALGYMGHKFGAKEQSAIVKFSEWLEHFGEKYTERIEKLIVAIGEKTPVIKKFLSTLNPKQKIVFGKAILTITLIIFAGKGLVELVHSLGEGEAGVAAIEGLLTGTKATEIVTNIPKLLPKIFKATTQAVVAVAKD